MRKAFVLVLISLTSFASILNFTKDAGIVSFKAKGKPALISILAKGTGIEGKLNLENNELSGHVTFDLKSLDSGIELRDDHMKNKYLEVDKFQTAKLELTKVKVTNSGETFKFQGLLHLRGVKKEISGEAKLDDNELDASFNLSLKDFNIEVPSHLGITVADNISITVKSEFTK